MADKPATKKPSPKLGGAGNKPKAAAKPTAKKKPIKKPPFVEKVEKQDLDLEDNG
jgi:hypothetical protein